MQAFVLPDPFALERARLCGGTRVFAHEEALFADGGKPGCALQKATSGPVSPCSAMLARFSSGRWRSS